MTSDCPIEGLDLSLSRNPGEDQVAGIASQLALRLNSAPICGCRAEYSKSCHLQPPNHPNGRVNV